MKLRLWLFLLSAARMVVTSFTAHALLDAARESGHASDGFAVAESRIHHESGERSGLPAAVPPAVVGALVLTVTTRRRWGAVNSPEVVKFSTA